MAATPFDYIRDPAEIYRRSFETVRNETDLSGVPGDLENVVLRLIHACGMPDIINDLRFSAGAGAAGRGALVNGKPVLTDAEMVRHGIIKSRLPAKNTLICTTHSPVAMEQMHEQQTTRSAVAVDQWLPFLDGAVVAIGNAPTALFRLLELLADGADRPAVIFGFPVGFIGAAESKQALVDHAGDIPYVTLLGRRGGSAIASAAVNALGGDSS